MRISSIRLYQYVIVPGIKYVKVIGNSVPIV